ncbi:hypothetical protein ONZ45_g626 [Pleurotus djamor]|nr:hypothetical protein ONZ45_g626 [Pleurotus djamor]
MPPPPCKKLAVVVEQYGPDAEPATSTSSVHRHTDYNASHHGFGHNTSHYSAPPEDTQTFPQRTAVGHNGHDADMDPPNSSWDPSFPLDYNEDAFDEADDGVMPRTRKRTYAGDNPMLVWMDERDTYIQELLALEAPAGALICARCSQPAMYRLMYVLAEFHYINTKLKKRFRCGMGNASRDDLFGRSVFEFN